MTSPPSLIHTAIDLSKFGKYSFEPGCADVGGTFSLIFAHNSGSFGFIGAFSTAGKGHRLHAQKNTPA